ncbi:hypothetical protein J5751_04790 [bacterium]|nr:hypothetical protein [bacterium]
MKFKQISNDITLEIKEIIGSYENFLTDTQKQAIYSYYEQAYYLTSKDYAGDDKLLARELIREQIEFLKNETFDSKRYKVNLINKFGFDTWVSWIFGKIRLDLKVKTTDISCVNESAKIFLKKKIKDFASVIGSITIIND